MVAGQRVRVNGYAKLLLILVLMQGILCWSGCAYPDNPSDPASPFHINYPPQINLRLDTNGISHKIDTLGVDSFRLADSISLLFRLTVLDEGDAFGYPPDTRITWFENETQISVPLDSFFSLSTVKPGRYMLLIQSSNKDGLSTSKKLLFFRPAQFFAQIDTLSTLINRASYLQVTFNARIRSDSGIVTGYMWDFGDFTNLTWYRSVNPADSIFNLKPVHFFTDTGIVHVRFYLFRNDGQTVHDSLWLNVRF